MKLDRIITLIFLVLLFFSQSCSLDYGIEKFNEESSPEFTFTNTTFSRVLDGTLNTSLKAETLEQFNNENAMYGKNLSFSLYNTDGEVTISGNCGMLSANTDDEIYSFYDSVVITSYEEDIKITAENIRWDNKSEQLISAGENPVTISSGGYSVSTEERSTDSSITLADLNGFKFSADGLKREFRFSGPVSGNIITGEQKENE